MNVPMFFLFFFRFKKISFPCACVHLASYHAGAIKLRPFMSEAVLQQTVTVISSDVPRLIPPTQLSAQIDAAVSILLV